MKVDIPGTTYQRDIDTKAILQTDRRAIDEYNVKRKLLNDRKAQEASINTMKEEIAGLKTDMDELKSLIKGLYK